jgi:hypothetical protein
MPRITRIFVGGAVARNGEQTFGSPCNRFRVLLLPFGLTSPDHPITKSPDFSVRDPYRVLLLANVLLP